MHRPRAKFQDKKLIQNLLDNVRFSRMISFYNVAIEINLVLPVKGGNTMNYPRYGAYAQAN